jgi:hypothetical protein
VPTSEKINEETADSLAKNLETQIENISKKGIDKNLLWEQCLLTPSCGTGSLSVGLAEKVFATLSELKELLRN